MVIKGEFKFGDFLVLLGVVERMGSCDVFTEKIGGKLSCQYSCFCVLYFIKMIFWLTHLRGFGDIISFM